MRKSKYPEGTICAVQICGRLRRKREWCDGHYGRWKSTGDVQETLPLPPPKKDPICLIVNCDSPEHARGLCASHYNQTTGVSPATGDPEIHRMSMTCSVHLCEDLRSSGIFCVYHADLDLRRDTGEFIIVDVLRARLVLPNGCWVHKNRSNDYGYNSLRVGSRVRGIHRVSYATHNGVDVDDLGLGLVVMHSCDNPPCFNPEHLGLGTEAENMEDASSKLRLRVGEENHYAKLKQDDVRSIRTLSSEYSAKDLAQKYNVHVVTIYNIINRKTWKHLNEE